MRGSHVEELTWPGVFLAWPFVLTCISPLQLLSSRSIGVGEWSLGKEGPVEEDGGGSDVFGGEIGWDGPGLLWIATGFSFWPPLLVFFAWYCTSREHSLVGRFWEVGRVFMMREGEGSKCPKKYIEHGMKLTLCNGIDISKQVKNMGLARQIQGSVLNEFEKVFSDRWYLFSPPYFHGLGWGQFGLGRIEVNLCNLRDGHENGVPAHVWCR